MNIKTKTIKNKKYHGLSIDVEDWFHILECKKSPPFYHWDKLDGRVNCNIEIILNILEKYDISATFFVLGWIAKKYPEIIQKIYDCGHEIGSHGHLHTMVSRMGPDEFARDLDVSIATIYRAINKDIKSYRAPGFSVTSSRLWVFEILASRGIKIDSSLFIGPHSHGGISLERVGPFEIFLPSGYKLTEFPIVSFPFLKYRIPFSGGGYLRLLPTPIVKELFKYSEKRGSIISVYVHPRDFDPYQPKINLSPVRHFKYYVGLNNFSNKFEELLNSFTFSSFENMLKTTNLDKNFYIEKHQLKNITSFSYK